jgi:ketosteroid isomerase-like protein
MKNHFALNRGASTFLNEFGHEDVFVAKMPQKSLTEWKTFESRDIIAAKLRKG